MRFIRGPLVFLVMSKVYLGAITAATFLKEFADSTPWVHLDIAGTAWLDDAKPHMAKGPSGVCVRTFVRLAMSWEKDDNSFGDFRKSAPRSNSPPSLHCARLHSTRP